MKSLTKISNTGAIALAVFLAACSSQPENKATQLEGLKKEQAELSKKIESLEKEIAKENPDAAKKVKMKDVKAKFTLVYTKCIRGHTAAEVYAAPANPGHAVQPCGDARP